MRGQHALQRRIGCVLLPCYLAACLSWQAQEASPEQVIADEQPDEMLVRLADGSQVVLDDPVVSGDTLTGLDSGTAVYIPLSEVTSVEIKGVSGSNTGVGIALVVIGVGVLVVLGLTALGNQR